MSHKPPADRLDSWKAIANYLGKSERTARRWEAEEGLPVNRQMHNKQGSAYAYRSEIDAWRRRREAPAAGDEQDRGASAAPAGSPGPAGSVAVLPFTYLGRDQQSAYIADGFTAEIIAGLSRVRSLRVISWTSSMMLKDTAKGVRVIGKELGVGRLVEGTVRHEGPRIKVAARLVDTRSDDRVWSQVYEGGMDELFAIQESLARQVVEYLELDYPGRPADGLTSHIMKDVAAWQCLVQARQAALRWHKDGLDHAVKLLRRGLALAEDDARLHAALGRTWLYYREAGVDLGPKPLEEARACAARAAALQPELATGHQLQGWIHYAEADVQTAVKALKTALEAEPWDPDSLSLLANCYLISGRVAAARPLIATLLSVDPLTPLNRCMPGWADALEGDFASAVGPYRDMFLMDPGNPLGRLFYTYMLVASGRMDEARRIAEEMPEPMMDSPAGLILGLFASAIAGDNASPELAGEDMAVLTQSTDMFPRFLGQAYALAGENDAALRWISVAVDRGFINYPFLAQHDPLLNALHAMPAYEALLARVKVAWERFQA